MGDPSGAAAEWACSDQASAPAELFGFEPAGNAEASEEQAKDDASMPAKSDSCAESSVVSHGSSSSGGGSSTDPVWVETVDGEMEEVEREVALLSPLIQREVLRFGHGNSREAPVVLPKQVGPDVLKLVLEYCRFHHAPGRSDKERKQFDERFIRRDTRRLCELTSAADSLDMKPLVDLTSRALARMIEGKTPEEIRETFHLPDDLTEEEKLEPVKNATDDPRIRLLNRLYARKRKELHDKKTPAASGSGARVGAVEKTDERSVEDLLSFIDGDSGGGSEGKGSKSKSKKKKGKNKKGGAKGGEEAREEAGGSAADAGDDNGQNALKDRLLRSQEVQDMLNNGASLEDLFPEDDFEDDLPADLDPAMKAELDREVEDFARRLNSDWSDRMQELLRSTEPEDSNELHSWAGSVPTPQGASSSTSKTEAGADASEKVQHSYRGGGLAGAEAESSGNDGESIPSAVAELLNGFLGQCNLLEHLQVVERGDPSRTRDRGTNGREGGSDGEGVKLRGRGLEMSAVLPDGSRLSLSLTAPPKR